MNRYTYAHNNPLKYTDPSGWWPPDPPEYPEEDKGPAFTQAGEVHWVLPSWYNGPSDPYAGMGFDMGCRLGRASVRGSTYRPKEAGPGFEHYYVMVNGEWKRRDEVFQTDENGNTYFYITWGDVASDAATESWPGTFFIPEVNSNSLKVYLASTSSGYPIFIPESYTQGSISKYEPNLFGRFQESRLGQSFLGKTVYSVIDDLFVTSTAFICGANKSFHLNYHYTVGTEPLDAGINTMTNFFPLGTFSKTTLGISGKTLNAGQFNATFKGTGITAASGGGRHIRLFNYTVRQSNSFSKLWLYINIISLSMGGF